MRTREELSGGIAELLGELRIKKGLSKAKIADLLYIDAHTWASWESGKSAPTVPEFIQAFDALNENALRAVLDYLYPDTYSELTAESKTSELRSAMLHYIEYIASDRIIRELSYLVYGEHGSNIDAQLNEFTAINHLPLLSKIVIAENVLALWELNTITGQIKEDGHIMPNLDLVRLAVAKAKDSVAEKSEAYTTGVR